MSTEKKPRGIWWKSLLAAALCLPLGATFVHQVEPELAASASEEPINIALLGIGGEGHQGGNLADSIMVASVRGEHAVLLSVPRDLYIDIDGQREGRINAAHAIGEARSADGIALITRALEGTLGIPIHHHVSGTRQVQGKDSQEGCSKVDTIPSERRSRTKVRPRHHTTRGTRYTSQADVDMR